MRHTWLGLGHRRQCPTQTHGRTGSLGPTPSTQGQQQINIVIQSVVMYLIIQQKVANRTLLRTYYQST